MADRALRRFQERLDNPWEWGPSHVRDFLYEEVSETPVIYVDGEPLVEYATGCVDRLATEGWSESDAQEWGDGDV